MFLILALGNEGKQYEKIRHNAGWIVIDEILSGVHWEESKHGKCFYSWQALVCNPNQSEDVVHEEKIEYVKPTTSMNRSGESLLYMLKNHPELTSDHIVVIHDDVALPLGEFKISYNRGSANHNGVESITNALGTKEYIRIRIGINERGLIPLANYVLMNFTEHELGQVKKLAPIIHKAIEAIICDGVDVAMNEFNK